MIHVGSASLETAAAVSGGPESIVNLQNIVQIIEQDVYKRQGPWKGLHDR